MYPKNAYFVDELNFYKKSLQVHKSSARQKISNRTHAFMHENIVDGDHNNSNIIDIANSISGGVPIPLNDLFGRHSCAPQVQRTSYCIICCACYD